MERLERVDVFGLSAICAWLTVSLFFAFAGDGAMFSRMGALGTAIAVLYFAYIPHAVPYPVGLRENLKLAINQGNFQANSIQALFKSRTIMAHELRPLFQEMQRPVPPLIGALSEESMVFHAAESAALPIEQWERENTQNTAAGIAADVVVDRVKFRAGLLQAWIVVIATLQWGFGDLPFSYFECGAFSC